MFAFQSYGWGLPKPNLIDPYCHITSSLVFVEVRVFDCRRLGSLGSSRMLAVAGGRRTKDKHLTPYPCPCASMKTQVRSCHRRPTPPPRAAAPMAPSLSCPRQAPVFGLPITIVCVVHQPGGLSLLSAWVKVCLGLSAISF